MNRLATFTILTLLLATLLGASTTLGATITTAGNGNWNSVTPNAPWPGGTVPAATDNVIIRSGDNVTVTANATIASVTFNNASASVANLTVNAGVVFTVTGALTLQNNSGNVNSSATVQGSGTINCASVTVGGTTAITALLGSPATTLTSTISTFSVSGNLSMTALSSGSAPAANNALFALGSGSVSVGGTVALTADNQNVNSTASLNLATGAQNGTLTLTGATPITTSGAGTKTFTANGTTATVNYAGTVAQSIQAVNYTNLKSNNTAGASLSAATTVKTLTIGDVTAASVFSDNGRTITLTAPSTLNLTSGTFKLGSAGTATVFPAFGTLNIAAGTTVEYMSGLTQTVSTTPSYQHLTYSGAGLKRAAAGTLTINGNWSVGSNTDLWTNNPTVNLSGNLGLSSGTLIASASAAFNIAGNWSNSATFFALGGTVTFNGVSQSISGASATTFSTMTIVNGSTVTGTTAPTIATFNINNGGKYIQPNGTAIPGGTARNFGASSTYEYQTTGQATWPGSVVTWGNLIINVAGSATNLSAAGNITTVQGNLQIKNAGTGSYSLVANTSSAVTISGNLVVDAGTFNISRGTGNPTVNVTGDVILNGGTFQPSTSTGIPPVNVSGNWTNNGGTFTPGTGTVTLTGTLAQAIGGSSATPFNNLTITNSSAAVSATTDFSAAGTLSVGASAVLTPASAVVISGTGTLTGSGTVQVTRTSATADFSSQYTISNKTLTNLTVEYIGGGAQTLSALAYGNLKINNSNGVTLPSADATVNGLLTFTSGNIITGSNKIIIPSAGSVSRTSGHVAGNLQKNVATGSNIARTFEIGGTTNYRPIDITFASVGTAGDLVATVSQSAGEHPSISSSGLDSTRDVNRFWSLTNSGIVFTNYSATFYFVAGDTDVGANTNNFVVRRFSSPSSWFSTTAGTRTSTSTEATGITGFSDYAIGDPCSVPTTANAGPDQEVCSTTSTLAGNTPGVGTGAWTVIAGGATVTTPSSPTSGVTGLSVGANSFVWTISNPCGTSRDTVIITRDATPTVSNAGPDQEVCSTTATLAGNTPGVGTGAWAVIAGSATVTTPSSPTSGVTGLSVGANSLVWTISNATCPASKDTVVITRDASPTAANAGPDQEVCATTATLAGNIPGVGTGAWTVISGSATVTTPGSPSSGVTGLSVGANSFVWTISNATCPPSGDTVTITRDTPPAVTTNPSNQTVCSGSSVSFMAAASGTPPSTVQWQVSTDGGSSFSDIGSATSATYTFTSGPSDNGRQYRAVFTNTCASATSTVATLTVQTAPNVTTQPSNTTVVVGANASFTAAGSGAPSPTLQWQVSTDAGSTFSDLIGETNISLSFAASNSQDGNRYRAVFTNPCGSQTTTAVLLTVNKANITLALSSSVDPSALAQLVTFTAKVSVVPPGAGTPSGSVTFYDGVISLGIVSLSADSARLITAALPAGSQVIKAVYNGDSNFNSDSATVTQTVNQGTPVVTMTSSLNPSTFEQNVTLKAKVDNASQTPTGSVTFYDGAASLGNVSLSGDSAEVSTASLFAGSHTIKAVYSGDSNFTSDSTTVTQTVNQAGPSVTLTSSLNPSTFEQSVSFKAKVNNASQTPTGSVAFFDGASSLGSVSLTGDSAEVSTASLSAGSHTIKAVYSGDSNFKSDSTTVTQTVNQAGPTVTLASSLNPSTFGQSVTLTAKVNNGSQTPTGSVTFYDGASSLGNASLTGDSARVSTSALTGGSHTIKAVYGGDGNFSPDSITITQMVDKEPTTSVLTSSLNPSIFGQSVTFKDSVDGSVPDGGIVVFKFDAAVPGDSVALNGSGVATLTLPTLTIGSHLVQAFYGGTGNFDTSRSNSVSQIVKPDTFTITASAGPSGTISPSGAVKVGRGASQMFSMSPNGGYHVDTVFVDGSRVDSTTSYTFQSVAANHTIQVTFAINRYTITATEGANGSISPSGNVNVNFGANQKFVITPDTGFTIADVLADSVSVGGVSTYTFVNVTTNHRIQASFAQINYPPTAARLTLPANRDTFNIASVPTPLNFIWQASTDPNNQDILLYALKVSGPGLDTTVSGLSGTSKALDLTSRLQAGASYLWTVSVTDGHVVVASPDTFSFTIRFTSGVNDGRNRIPKEYALYQNYPNPFNPSTRIQFDIPHQSVVTMKLYNLLGEEMATLVDHQTMSAGVQVVALDASHYSSGIYFYRLVADGPNGKTFVSLKKMTLLK